MLKEKPVAVLFRIYPEGDVIALFPDIPGTSGQDCSCYQHIGQHSSAHFNYVCQNTRKAHKKEYQALFNELTHEPFNYEFRIIQNYRKRKNLL
jgi:hypothetical protein